MNSAEKRLERCHSRSRWQPVGHLGEVRRLGSCIAPGFHCKYLKFLLFAQAAEAKDLVAGFKDASGLRAGGLKVCMLVSSPV